jgi:hypothetical protein
MVRKIVEIIRGFRLFWRGLRAPRITYAQFSETVLQHVSEHGLTRVYDLYSLFPGLDAVEEHPGTPVLSIAQTYIYLLGMEEAGLIVSEMHDHEGKQRMFIKLPGTKT